MIKKVVTQIQTGSKSNPVICAVELRQDKTATDLSSEKTQEATNDTTVSGFATGFNDGDFTTGGGFNFPAIDVDTMRLIAGNLLSGTRVVETPIVSNWINAYKNVTLTTSLQNVNASGKSTVQAKIVVDSGDSIFKNESILFAQFLFKDVGELGETKTITLTNQSVDSPDDYIEITLSSSVKIGTRYLGYVRGQFFGFKATTGMELVQRLYAIQESVTTGMGEEYKQFLTFPWSMSHTKACIPTSFTQSVEIISDDNSKDCNTTLSTLFNGLYMENLDIDIKKGGTSSSTSLIGTEFATEETSKTMLDYIKDEKYFEKELKDQNVDLVGIAEIDKKGIYGLSGELKVDETSFDNPFPARGVHLLKGANAGADVKVTVYYKRGETGNKIGVEKEFSFKNSANEEIFRVKTGTDLDDGDIYIFVVGDTYGKLVLIDDSPAENVNRNTNINPNTVGDYGSYFTVVADFTTLAVNKIEVENTAVVNDVKIQACVKIGVGSVIGANKKFVVKDSGGTEQFQVNLGTQVLDDTEIILVLNGEFVKIVGSDSAGDKTLEALSITQKDIPNLFTDYEKITLGKINEANSLLQVVPYIGDEENYDFSKNNLIKDETFTSVKYAIKTELSENSGVLNNNKKFITASGKMESSLDITAQYTQEAQAFIRTGKFVTAKLTLRGDKRTPNYFAITFMKLKAPEKTQNFADGLIEASFMVAEDTTVIKIEGMSPQETMSFPTI